MSRGFSHTLCEVCWFRQNPERFPVQIRREAGDYSVDLCCTCGSMKVTQIWVRLSPDDATLRCDPRDHG